ncbi:uncharacterized protein LOC118458413 [Anopheles albimanus]|uniref:Uncharacterized protein n=1 Tax=Anopheles albimanus TaxID=7167 RepID=A0A182FQU9_ANOAL|nr:uncharacterized protein LOC118458413 [Anopheles albimanus]XP_035776725.1 uncharacterized protein LOC118458413 [Anopheles albimanus]XP_035776726.1 uncharacterized protein LOC118458413 [Anopheles albimanus]
MNRVVRIVAVAGSLLVALSMVPAKVYGDNNFHDHAEASQHVMHIRKLTDGDDLKIELEPVWFQLESAELPFASDNQQVKRQTLMETRRPYKIYSHLENLQNEREQKRNRLMQSRAEPEAQSVESDEQRSSLRIRKMTSVEEQLDDLELPGCFRKFLQEMEDRNHEGVRRLMRCLAQQQTRSRDGDRKKPRPARQFKDSSEPTDEPRARPYRRKVTRRTKNDANHETTPSPLEGAESDLMFQKHYIRSESDDEGQLFERDQRAGGASSEASDASPNKSSSSGDEEDFEVKSTEDESDQETHRHASNEGKVPYRRPMQKQNANTESQSTEEANDSSSSSEESQAESDEHY